MEGQQQKQEKGVIDNDQKRETVFQEQDETNYIDFHDVQYDEHFQQQLNNFEQINKLRDMKQKYGALSLLKNKVKKMMMKRKISEQYDAKLKAFSKSQGNNSDDKSSNSQTTKQNDFEQRNLETEQQQKQKEGQANDDFLKKKKKRKSKAKKKYSVDRYELEQMNSEQLRQSLVIIDKKQHLIEKINKKEEDIRRKIQDGQQNNQMIQRNTMAAQTFQSMKDSFSLQSSDQDNFSRKMSYSDSRSYTRMNTSRQSTFRKQQSRKIDYQQQFVQNFGGIKYFKLFSHVIQILKKNPSKRNGFEVFCVFQLFKNLKFFQKYVENNQTDLAMNICKHLGYIQCEENSVLCRKGDMGSTFFIIMQGQLSFYDHIQKDQATESEQIKKQQTMMNTSLKHLRTQEIEKKKQVRRKSQIAGANWMMILKGSRSMQQGGRSTMTYEDSVDLKYKYQMEILKKIENQPAVNLNNCRLLVKMSQGQSFGELAILYNQPRQATVICDSKCDLVILEKKVYQDLISQDENQKIQQQVRHLKNIALFKSIDETKLVNYYMTCKKVLARKDQVIYREGDSDECIYMVLKGEFQVYRSIENQDNGFGIEPNYKKIKNEMTKKQFNAEDYNQFAKEIGDKLNNPRIHYQMKGQELEEIELRLGNVRYIDLMVHNEGQVFGDFDGRGVRVHNAKCKSAEGELLAMPYAQYKKIQISLKYDVHTQEVIQRQAQKNQYMEKQFVKQNMIRQSKLQNQEFIRKLENIDYIEKVEKEIQKQTEKNKNMIYKSEKLKEKEINEMMQKKFKNVQINETINSRFNHISKCQKDWNHGFKVEADTKTSVSLQRDKIRKKFFYEYTKKQRAERKAIMSEKQCQMASLGLGMLSQKNSKHFYFKNRTQKEIDEISFYKEELPYKKYPVDESVVENRRKVDMKQIEQVLNKKLSQNNFPQQKVLLKCETMVERRKQKLRELDTRWRDEKVKRVNTENIGARNKQQTHLKTCDSYESGQHSPEIQSIQRMNTLQGTLLSMNQSNHSSQVQMYLTQTKYQNKKKCKETFTLKNIASKQFKKHQDDLPQVTSLFKL